MRSTENASFLSVIVYIRNFPICIILSYISSARCRGLRHPISSQFAD